MGRGVGDGAGVLTTVGFGDAVAELGVAGGQVDAALGESEHPSVSTTRESAVRTRRIHRHYVDPFRTSECELSDHTCVY